MRDAARAVAAVRRGRLGGGCHRAGHCAWGVGDAGPARGPGRVAERGEDTGRRGDRFLARKALSGAGSLLGSRPWCAPVKRREAVRWMSPVHRYRPFRTNLVSYDGVRSWSTVVPHWETGVAGGSTGARNGTTEDR